MKVSITLERGDFAEFLDADGLDELPEYFFSDVERETGDYLMKNSEIFHQAVWTALTNALVGLNHGQSR